MNKSFMIIMLGIVIIALSIAQVYACAMTAVVCQGDYTLMNGMVGFGDGSSGGGESKWLYNMGNSNQDAHGMVYYHREGYGGHNYKVLEANTPIDTVSVGSNNHLYRHSGRLSLAPYAGYYNKFVQAAKLKQGKIFMGHVRYMSDPLPGAFAPFVYRHIGYVNGVADTTDYSFAHHGTVDKWGMYHEANFQNWLSNYDIQNILNGNPTYYSVEESVNNYIDSDYLFLWLVMYIENNNGDVKLGLVEGLSALTAKNISGQINILFSDGTGVYAYSNNSDATHKMSYKSQQSIYHYIRSYNAVESNWTQLDSHNLYYFPTQGQMEITYNADNCVPASFALKQGLNWISFPVLNTIAQYNPMGWHPDYVLQDINQYANTLQTKNGITLQPIWMCDDVWPSNASLSRTNGYILTMDNTSSNYEYLTFGQKTPYNTALSLYQNNENWVPYFIEYSQAPVYAFGGNFSHVTAIYAQDWYTYKFKGKWYGYCQVGATGTLDYGKMYKVYVDQSITNFTWSAIGQSQPFVKEATSYFQYEEKPEYQAIIIESIPDNPVFDEIGVFKSGECIGAQKYDGYPINLQVYDNSSPDEYDYVLYSESKHNNIAERKYVSTAIDIEDKVVNNGRQMFSVINLSGGQDIDTTTPPVLSAMIYPNPMRGNTSIEIKSNAKSSVEICIYNLKGQLVRNIESSELAKGNTTFVWNGKTNDGRAVSQGIYFCKIKSPNNVLTKKLIVIE